MPSIVSGYEYDIFISYRQNDNRSGWVTEFVNALQEELAATIKEPVSIYFDTNPHDGLLETHDVHRSLEGKLKCLIFIPILSQTYCDPKSFAWQYEFCAFNRQAATDTLGKFVKLRNGNVTSRILPVRIHELDDDDKGQIEKETGGVLRPIDFIFKSPGVNRPLRLREEHPQDNLNKTYYADQVNKVANAVKDITMSLKGTPVPGERKVKAKEETVTRHTKRIGAYFGLAFVLLLATYFILTRDDKSQPFNRTLAVLPFVNMSNDRSQDYFSDGIMDEILSHLYKIGDLRVTSRTTSMTYKGSTKSLREIASELNAGVLLQGSVQKDSNRIRIRVQLIDGQTDAYLWAETYQMELKDVFLVQSEIAQAVATALKIELNQEVKARIAGIPTQNVEAYKLYLLSYTDAFSQERRIEMLNKAIRLDTGFADAYAALASLWINSGGHGGTVSAGEAVRMAKPLLAKALQLNPDLALVHQVLGMLHLYYERDFQKVEREFNQVVKLNPANSRAIVWFTDYLIAIGRGAEALQIAKVAVQADSSFFNLTQLALAFYFNNEPQSAVETIDRAGDLFPDNDFVRLNSIRIKGYQGMYKEAIADFEKDTSFYHMDPIPATLGHMGVAYYKAGRISKAEEYLESISKKNKQSPVGSPSFFTAAIYAAMGNNGAALEYLEKAYLENEVEMYWLKVEPLFNSLHDEPNWRKLLDKMNYPK